MQTVKRNKDSEINVQIVFSGKAMEEKVSLRDF